MLYNLLLTQDAIARLEASVEAASPEIRAGLRSRMSYREAAGWLAHHGFWIHPLDLALRDMQLTGAYAAATLGTRLPSVLPATTAGRAAIEALPNDRDVATALRIAQRWRRLAELPSWTPEGELPEPDGDPPLLSAVRLLVAEGINTDAHLRAAWLWRARGGTGNPGLPLWSAPIQHLTRASLAAEPERALLGCIAEAALAARRELARLTAAAARGQALPATARSHLPDALAAAIRAPVITAGTLGRELGITSRAAAGLIARLTAAGLLREATGRKAWRGFVLV